MTKSARHQTIATFSGFEERQSAARGVKYLLLTFDKADGSKRFVMGSTANAYALSRLAKITEKLSSWGEEESAADRYLGLDQAEVLAQIKDDLTAAIGAHVILEGEEHDVELALGRQTATSWTVAGRLKEGK